MTVAFSLPPPHELISIAIVGRSTLHSAGVFEANQINGASYERSLVHHAADLPGTLSQQGQDVSLSEFLRQTGTKAFVVLHSGDIVFEQYAEGVHRDSIVASFSIAKAILSTLVGLAYHRGDLPSLDADGRHLLRDGLADRLHRPISVTDLLNMRAGIGVPESYDSFSRTAGMYLTTDLDRFLQTATASPRRSGRSFDYRSVEYQLLGKILQTSTRHSLSDYLGATLWQSIGARTASWSVDSRFNRVEKAFCCINARVADFALFGQWILEASLTEGDGQLPKDWFSRIRAPQGYRGGLGYSHGWWLPADRTDDDFAAVGIYGQYIYVNPTHGVVIVKFSAYGAEQEEEQILEAFQQIARFLGTG